MTEPKSVGLLLKPMQSLTLRKRKWCYKGEGNANVILAMPEFGTVVRVIKGEMTADEMAMTLLLHLSYFQAVQRLFFTGCDYLDVPVPMTMSAEELHDIDLYLRQYRPANRKHKSLGWAGGLVTVCPDYTVFPRGTIAIGPVFCVEIKPKQGWLHEADRVHLTYDKCMFCAHQYLKLIQGDIHEVSQYCPLDLFSGHRKRVDRAVRGLFRTPQNNLKIFRDGTLLDDNSFGKELRHVFGDNAQFFQFITATLLGDFNGHEETLVEENVLLNELLDCEDKLQCDFDAIPMPQHCVLHKILSMQKMQTTGFAAVCSEYEQLPKSTAQQLFGHVDRLNTSTAEDKILQRPVDGYLVATTARDCSVFVTFCRTNSDCTEQCVVLFDDHCYAVYVKVSDLDPKPLSTIDKHRKRNADVLQACDQFLGQSQE